MDGNKINEKMTVREACTRWPQTKNVFHKHGLMECGGPQGPIEQIGFFARAHRVDKEKLLKELNAAIKNSPGFSESVIAAEKEFGYEKFLKAAIFIMLTAGCTLGAFMIFGIGFNKSFELGWETFIQAHGHLQVFGWVGLFIMGIAFFVMPRFKNSALFKPGLAEASFWLMLTGLLLRFVAQPNAANFFNSLLLVASALLELLAISIFALVLWKTIKKSAQEKEEFEKFIFAGVFWFFVLGLLNLFSVFQMVLAGEFIAVQATEEAVFHAGLLGFIAMMVFAVAARTLAVFMGLGEQNKKALSFSFVALNLGTALMVLSALELIPSIAAIASAALELAAVIAFVLGIKVFSKPEIDLSKEGFDKSYGMFVKVSFAWLVFSAAMLLAIELQKFFSGSVEHAFVGAYRHAFTVGFASMMIFGYATRIIPVFKGTRIHSKRLVMATFWFVNIGNAMRVFGQILAGFFGGIFFAAIAVSGFVELVGIFAFGINIWKTLGKKYEEQEQIVVQEENSAAKKTAKLGITKNLKVFDVVQVYPEALGFFVNQGFKDLKNPVKRNTVARIATLEMACKMHNKNVNEFIGDLKKFLKQ